MVATLDSDSTPVLVHCAGWFRVVFDGISMNATRLVRRIGAGCGKIFISCFLVAFQFIPESLVSDFLSQNVQVSLAMQELWYEIFFEADLVTNISVIFCSFQMIVAAPED